MVIRGAVTKPQDKKGVDYSIVDFTESLQASFIGTEKPSDDRYSPRIITNDENRATNVLSVLKNELVDCTSFDFSVAFITDGGIQILIEALQMLQSRGIHGRILTSTYLNFNSPEALAKLLEFPNIETRIYQGDLHAKGYFFNSEPLSTFVIGSSNLTQTALTCNKEWNVLFRSYSEGELLSDVKNEFEQLWNSHNTVQLTEDWLKKYETFLNEEKQRLASTESFQNFTFKQPIETSATPENIKPNQMQHHALEALGVLHGRDEKRALLVSATGTGKTYLAAFDVKQTKPRKVLFIAHRRRILSASLNSFKRVLGNEYSYGFLSSGEDISNKTCVFAMSGYLASHLDQFSPDEFDYIIIDEAHRTGAKGYLKIIEYFDPKFLLGMTATPNRTDGYDVYNLFNHVIAYRITLQDALSNEMLAPFHYFGIADLNIGDESLDDVALFSKLTSDERVKHVVEKIEAYTVCKEERRGLIFCSRNTEAAELSAKLNALGYRTRAISGETSEDERNQAIDDLENGKLQYILSVDIMNEGIDIPSINQIIMLRRTDSTVVFTQQLGRGLRKLRDKEFTLVLDFIGNYQNNFLIPMALSGDRTYNKDTLRKVVKEGNSCIPGCSTISFDPVSEQRIFKALEEGRFNETRLIRGEFEHLKQILGRTPSLLDFDNNEAIDPMIIIKKFGSYAAFLQKYDPSYINRFNERELNLLKFLSVKLASGKRATDLLLLKELLEANGVLDISKDFENINKTKLSAAARMLDGSYSTRGVKVVNHTDSKFELTPEFKKALTNPDFRYQLLDFINFGLARNKRDYSETYKDTEFVLNQKYNREEICRLLGWKAEPNYQNIGGYFHDKVTNTFPVFINYEKDPSISITTQYEDRFVSDRKLIAISKSNRNLSSPEIKKLAQQSENGMRCYLFMRKNSAQKGGQDNDDKEFYFLGEIYPTGEFNEITMADGSTKAVEITYELEAPVRADLYDYITKDLYV